MNVSFRYAAGIAQRLCENNVGPELDEKFVAKGIETTTLCGMCTYGFVELGRRRSVRKHTCAYDREVPHRRWIIAGMGATYEIVNGSESSYPLRGGRMQGYDAHRQRSKLQVSFTRAVTMWEAKAED